jgi:CDGSH-type Zn-finger protein
MDGAYGVSGSIETPDRRETERGSGGAQADVAPCIQVTESGPYLVTDIDDLRTWLGEPIPTRPSMKLCRCGHSQNKPFCDGTHAKVGFSGAKDPKRVPDRRDTYRGL